jgi:16S rRNA G1207 methylase RsmC
VVIPLQPYTKEIIQKYNGDFPNKKNKATFRAQIKEIGKLASINSDVVITSKKGIEKVDNFYKKYELISSHTCRRSFCTNQYLRGIPTVLLMKISGHSTEKAFMRYIKIDEEMAAKKMMEYWNKKADK